jgi:hypothetical protein
LVLVLTIMVLLPSYDTFIAGTRFLTNGA